MLPELLVVLVIIGVLSAIVASGVSHLKSQAELVACRSDVAATATAAEVYLARHQRYPEDVAALRAEGYLRGDATHSYSVAYSAHPDGQGFSLTGTTGDGTVCANSTG